MNIQGKRLRAFFLLSSVCIVFNGFCQQKNNQPLESEDIVTLIRENTLNQADIFAHIFQQSKNAIVQIFNYGNSYNVLQPYNPIAGQDQSTGTGFFINSTGEIITNYHVVAQSVALFIQIPCCGREQFEVEYVGGAPALDVALLRLTSDSLHKLNRKYAIQQIPFLELGNSDEITSAQLVMAVGYPLGEQNIKSASGEIAGKSDDLLQITAPINPGNSGGPVFNKDGKVVGIAVAKITGEAVDCVAYMIPIEHVKTIMEELRTSKIVHNPYWGITAAPTTPETRNFLKAYDIDGGIYIEKIKKGSLIELAEFQEGDIIYMIDGFSIDSYGYIASPWRSNEKASIGEYLKRKPFGSVVSLKAYRNGKSFTKDIVIKNQTMFAINYVYPWIDALPDYEIIGGMVVMDLTINHLHALQAYAHMYDMSDLMKYGKEENRYKGKVLITDIFPNSPAHLTRAIYAGSIIDEVNGCIIETVADFRKAIAESEESVVAIKTENGSFVVLPIEKIIAAEASLSKIYRYDISPLYYKLLAL